MAEKHQDESLSDSWKALLDEAAKYFQEVSILLYDREIKWSEPWLEGPTRSGDRDAYWNALPSESKEVARGLEGRLIKFVSRIAASLRSSPLSSEADRRDLQIAIRAMRAALLLRSYHFHDAEVMHDEDVVLGVRPAQQSDDMPASADDAEKAFKEWAEKVSAVIAITDAAPSQSAEQSVLAGSRYRPGTAFIMMWIDPSDPSLQDVADRIKEVFAKFEIKAVRADEIEHEGVITGRIRDEIQTAEFLFADLTGERPNVYYEVGYAHALRRPVMLYRKKGTRMHFDLAAYNCPEYENLGDLGRKLTQRLESVTGRQSKN